MLSNRSQLRDKPEILLLLLRLLRGGLCFMATGASSSCSLGGSEGPSPKARAASLPAVGALDRDEEGGWSCPRQRPPGRRCDRCLGCPLPPPRAHTLGAPTPGARLCGGSKRHPEAEASAPGRARPPAHRPGEARRRAPRREQVALGQAPGTRPPRAPGCRSPPSARGYYGFRVCRTRRPRRPASRCAHSASPAPALPTRRRGPTFPPRCPTRGGWQWEAVGTGPSRLEPVWAGPEEEEGGRERPPRALPARVTHAGR